jgi:putative alpha-1,2-mannosidase
MLPQVGTHADSLIAEAVLKGMSGFDLETAWEAVYSDATVPPVNDTTTVWV